MASWWRRIALSLGDGVGTGSWKKRAAQALGYEHGHGQSWPEIIRTEGDINEQSQGSHTRRMVDEPEANATNGPWSKRLFVSGRLVDELVPPEFSYFTYHGDRFTFHGDAYGMEQ